jgi:putative transposase
MIDFNNSKISVEFQCSLLGISRSTVYYKPRQVKQRDLDLMRIIDEQYLETPFYGSRSMRNHIRRLGWTINRKPIQRLMKRMGLQAIYPKPKTTKPHPQNKVYPYLLRGLKIAHPDQVWAADITYVPMSRGFMYLVAIMDWHSRKVLSWRVSNSMDADFCVEALEEVIVKYGCPEIFNTDQGSQFTSESFIKVLKDNHIKISMDGRGRFMDNIFIERLWWTVKYQYLYLRAFEGGKDLRKGLKKWFRFYNRERSHQSLSDWTPNEIYYKKQGLGNAA